MPAAARSPEHAELIALQGARLARLEREARARLMGQPVEGADGRVGVVKHVGVNCDNRVVAQIMEWKGGPTTYYAENLTVLEGKA